MDTSRIINLELRPFEIIKVRLLIYSRLNHQDGYGGWCPDQTMSGEIVGAIFRESIEVKLNMPVRLKGIVTQGRYNGEEKVEDYVIRYTPDIKKVLPKWINDEQTKNARV